MTFQQSFDNDTIDGNDEWWQWDCMMNVDENVDDLKDYLDPWDLKPSNTIKAYVLSNHAKFWRI